jgi:predicted nucleotidyltransferase
MNQSNDLQFAVKTIKEILGKAEVPVLEIYLFGSRARGDYSTDSDWDFLVCSSIEIPFRQKAQLTGEIQTVLAVRNISADIIIKSENKIKNEKSDVGIITYYAFKDGVLV